MKKVIIGIVAKHNDTGKLRLDSFIRDEVKDCILDNGGVAIGILNTMSDLTLMTEPSREVILKNLPKLFTQKEQNDLKEEIALCDGVILQGGSKSDVYEIWIAKYCHEHNIPLLAICAGQNNMVQAVGGSIKSLGTDTHYKMREQYVHSIKVDKSSLFYKIVKTETMPVNSRHLNTVSNPGKLKISAIDMDGNIEVVEAPNKLFYLGVRFHPESLYRTDKNHNAIIKAFILACKKYNKQKNLSDI